MAYIGNELVGTLRLDTKDQPGMVGQLAVSSQHRGKGIGLKLQNFCQNYAKNEIGLNKLMIELVNPTEFKHEFKTFLLAWYQRLGFEIVKEIDVVDHPVYAGLADILLTPCKFIELEKSI